ncbi:MAG TPA: hypothetical protein VFJ90_10640 [Candidatus Didemnitutus sp.]|nr:hypothetical protein [Candidatus Didemnitutus sp.]
MKLLAAAVLSAIALATSAAGIVESVPLNFVFSGVNPTNSTPLILKLEDGLTLNTVRLTMDATNLGSTEFVSEWYLNLNPAFTPGSLSFSLVSNPTALVLGDIGTGANAFKADGDGFYDVLFAFPPPPGQFSAKFTAGEKVVVDITRASGLSVADFLYSSVNGGGAGTYLSAAHIQGIGSDSAWIGATAAVGPLPEPSAYASIIGCVMLGVALRRKWRSKRYA